MLVLAVGGFGRRVAQRLSTVDSSVAAIDVTTGTHPAAWPDADLYVLAAEWEADELVEMVESSAFAWRRPWFPVLLDHPHLRVGPVVVPGQSACHRCFDRRRRQHAKSPQPSWRHAAHRLRARRDERRHRLGELTGPLEQPAGGERAGGGSGFHR